MSGSLARRNLTGECMTTHRLLDKTKATCQANNEESKVRVTIHYAESKQKKVKPINSKKIMCQKIFSENTFNAATTEDAYKEILNKITYFQTSLLNLGSSTLGD